MQQVCILRLAPKGIAAQKTVFFVVTKTKMDECNSALAQGGIVSVMPEINKNDNVTSHIMDTIKAGCGLNDFNVVKFISENSSYVINDLIDLGLNLIKKKTAVFLLRWKRRIQCQGFYTLAVITPEK